MRLLAPLLLALCAASAPPAQPKPAAPEAAGAPSAEARALEKQFKALGLIYDVTEVGDYSIVYAITGEGRSHEVRVRPQTSAFDALVIREVFAVAHEYSGPVPSEVAAELLALNSTYIIGAWSVEDSAVIFIARIAADASDAELQAAMDAVVLTADEMENRLSGGADEW